MKFQIDILAGELADRVTILRLKKKFAPSPEALLAARDQLELLEPMLKKLTDADTKILMFVDELADTNWRLWDLEDNIRREIKEEFSATRVIGYSADIIDCNNRRARIKRDIDSATGLELGDVKTYNGETL